MKKSKLGLLFLSSLALVTGVASTGVAGVLANQSNVSVAKASSFSTTYTYGLSGWTLTNCTDALDYYRVPSGSQPSVATITDIFTGKIVTSDITITINNATYGSGDNPTSSTFSVFADSNCETSVAATQSGTLSSSKTYVNTIYTIKYDDVSAFSDNLVIKIVKPGKQIRLKQIKVEFTYESSSSSVHTISYQNVTGASNNNPVTYTEGTEVALSPAIKEGYIFDGWVDSDSNKIESIPADSTEDIVLTATWTEHPWHRFESLKTVGSLSLKYNTIRSDDKVKTDTSYELITSIDDIAVGDKVIIAAANYAFVASSTPTVNKNGYKTNIQAVSGDKNSSTGTIVPGDGFDVFEVAQGSSEGTFAFYTTNRTENGYISTASNSDNWVSITDSIGADSSWKVTVNGDTGATTMVATDSSYTKKNFRFNNNSSIFSCYSTGQYDVALYKQVEGKEDYVYSYNINDVGLRFAAQMNTSSLYSKFGEFISKSIYSSVSFGVSICMSSSWSQADSVTKVCESIGVDGANTQFALVMSNIPASAWTTSFSAKAYVEVDGVKHYAAAKTTSVKTMAKDYLTSYADNEDVVNNTGVLSYLANYKGA